MCGMNAIGDLIYCYFAISVLLIVVVEMIDSGMKKYIYMSANAEWRTQQVEIVEFVEIWRCCDESDV
jgi:hypothetical protein